MTHNKEDVFRNSCVRDTGTEGADELVKLLNKVADIYCENDFLIKKNRVEILVLQHQHLMVTRNIIEEKSKKVNYVLRVDFVNLYSKPFSVCG